MLSSTMLSDINGYSSIRINYNLLLVSAFDLSRIENRKNYEYNMKSTIESI